MRKGKNMLEKTPTDEIVTDLYEQAEDGTCPKKLAKKSAKHIRAQEAEIKRLRADLPPTRAQVEAMVRPLVWEGLVSGPYEITVKEIGIADLLSHAVHDEDVNPDYIWGGYLTLISIDDLKAAAQADYTARILSALNLGDE